MQVQRLIDLSAQPASSLASLHCGTPSQARPAGRQSAGAEVQEKVVLVHLGGFQDRLESWWEGLQKTIRGFEGEKKILTW